MEIWRGVPDALQTDGLTLKDRSTQLLIKYKSGAFVTQQQMSVMSVSLQMSTFLSNKINEKITISLLKSDFRGYFICMFKIVSNQKELPNSICNP